MKSLFKPFLPIARALLRKRGYDLVCFHPDFPLVPPIDTNGVAILKDNAFRRSVTMAQPYTLLDVARLANLWNLARMTGPGILMEVGTYRGGGALHISNACPNRHLYIFDTFAGFRSLTPGLDDTFHPDWFKDTSKQHVMALFEPLGRKVNIVEGFFPESASSLSLDPVAFCHLDVDTYDATISSLRFLADKLSERSLVILDDYRRNAGGVDQAVEEFLADHQSFMCLPMFPGQGLLFSRDKWQEVCDVGR